MPSSACRQRPRGICLALLLSTAAAAPGARAQPTATVADAAALAVVRDSMPSYMKRMGIPGAVVTVVRGDRVLMNQAFGVADVARNIPVNADSTVFRIASVSKVFTALAATRLSADGRLDLHADIARWVPEIDLDATSENPVTVAQLLTHTAGIDERLLGYLNPVGATPPPLAEHMPPRTRLPEGSPGYSNHGYALVGLAVERITHTPFDAWLRDSVFRPLGMTRTGFILRPPAPSQALEYTSGGDLRVERSSVPYPAGNIGTTGGDMAIFLQALNRARHDTTIAGPLKGRAAALLYAPELRYHPEMPPMGYAFAAVIMANREIWMKGGASPSHSAVIALVPELELAIFIAVNRQEPTLWERLLPHLVASYAGAVDRGAGETPASPPVNVSGDYLFSRAALGSVEKVIGLATQIRVRDSGDTLVVSGPFMDGTYVRDGVLRYRRSDNSTLAFRVDAAGRPTRAFTIIGGQPTSFEAIPLHRTTRFQMGALVGATVLALAAGIMTLKRAPGDESQPVWARASIVALPAAQLLTVGSAIVLATQGDRLLEGPTSALYATLSMTTLTALTGLAQSAGSMSVARNSKTILARSTYAAAAAAGLTTAWFLSANNLIGFRF